MAESLWSKARLIVKSRLHGLLDEVANTPEAFKQRIRDLEVALADLNAAGDEQKGTAVGHRRQLAKLESEKARAVSEIELLLGDGDETNNHFTVDMELRVGELEEQMTVQLQLAEEAERNYAELQKAVDQLEAKHREMLNQLNRLTVSQAAASAKNRAASAVESALSAAASAEGAGVDSIANRIDHDRAVADARFERVIGGLSGSESPERAAALARAKARLAERSAKIAEAAKEQATQPAT